jgi:hypothetical protein
MVLTRFSKKGKSTEGTEKGMKRVRTAKTHGGSGFRTTKPLPS